MIDRKSLPHLAAEDHVCGDCALSYPDTNIEQAVQVITALPRAVQEAVSAIPREARRIRPNPTTWSVTEYVCHLRDVYVTYTVRLHRTRTEDNPSLEPVYNELRARRFRYNERDVGAVMDELQAVAVGFCDEIARVRHHDWERTATRLPGEQRTARWRVACRHASSRERGGAYLFWGKPSSMPPWLGSSQRLVMALPRVKNCTPSAPWACASPNSDAFQPPKL